MWSSKIQICSGDYWLPLVRPEMNKTWEGGHGCCSKFQLCLLSQELSISHAQLLPELYLALGAGSMPSTYGDNLHRIVCRITGSLSLAEDLYKALAPDPLIPWSRCMTCDSLHWKEHIENIDIVTLAVPSGAQFTSLFFGISPWTAKKKKKGCQASVTELVGCSQLAEA